MMKNNTMVSSLSISAIRVGRRHRKHLGDLQELAASIAEIGLLHPIVVTPDKKLIAGERRLRATKLLGWTKVPVRVVDLNDIIRGEHAENTHRLNLTPSEAVAIAHALEPLERKAAKQRQGTRTDKHPGKLPRSSMGRAGDKIARATGVSRRTLEKAAEIVAAAEANPRRYGSLVTGMDKSGHVNGYYHRLKILQQAEAIRREPPQLPGRGPYRVIVVDPPWPWHTWRKNDPSNRIVGGYPRMSIEEICAVDVASIAARDCILWLWTTNHHMRNAFRVLDAWGFKEYTMLTWVKNKIGMGDWLKGQTEHCIMAARGKPVVELTTQTTALHAPRRAHSQKPREFYKLVEKLCPAPRYAYLFSRHRPGPNWDCHGNEAPKYLEAAE
jgi:N6-adenosine-specific RNA methylase IME4